MNFEIPALLSSQQGNLEWENFKIKIFPLWISSFRRTAGISKLFLSFFTLFFYIPWFYLLENPCNYVVGLLISPTFWFTKWERVRHVPILNYQKIDKVVLDKCPFNCPIGNARNTRFLNGHCPPLPVPEDCAH